MSSCLELPNAAAHRAAAACSFKCQLVKVAGVELCGRRRRCFAVLFPLRTPPCCLPSRIPSISSCELQVIKKYNAHLLARRHGAIATLTTTWITWTDEFEISMKIPKTCILHYAKLHVVPCLYYYHKQLKTSQKKQSPNALYILSFFRHSIPKPWDKKPREKKDTENHLRH